MPSPFPGMNPYLEQPAVWPDFHSGYVIRLRNTLAPLILPRYLVRAEEQVYLHELPDSPGRLVGRPDLGVLTPHPPPAEGPTGAAVAGPAVIDVSAEVDEVRTRYLEVRDRQEKRLVTVIELLSPSNKAAGPDRAQYLAKRQRLMRAGVNYVEIDLLRGGRRLFDRLPECDYYTFVFRATEYPRANVWPLRLADRLPSVPIPLLSGDPEPQLDLQAALDAEYDQVGYVYSIYDHPPEPPLTSEQAAWAAGFVPGTPAT